ncbi:MAG TPA: DNA primase [Chakrabartia sp.]|jgi:DNA primase|nr:DNA primase [Chakrabartia sp.]
MSLSPQFLDELRSRTLLSALVGRTVKLTKAGREHKGCCPFHNEKTPSFYVNDEKGFYHCFGCSTHGDAIRWMTDQRGLSFIDAVKELADAAGMDVPAPDPRAAERAERANSLHDVMKAAADWFAEQLGSIEGAEARTYLDKRGLKAETIRTFGLGFAPDSRGKLRAALKQFGDDKLIESGLLISVDDKEPYDRFRGRLMIPIRDPRGRVIAFGGRILGQGEPKYLNSPDTPLFDKGRTLYNLDLALDSARKSNTAIVVEGYLDAISIFQQNILEVVAPLGTSLTKFQIDRLWSSVDTPIICFDGDNPGKKAAERAAMNALQSCKPGKSVSIAILPLGEDPDDHIKNHGIDSFREILSSSNSLPQFLYTTHRDRCDTESPTDRARLRSDLENLSKTCENSFVSEEFSRTFRGYFFEDFGWKSKFRKVVASCALKTGPIGQKRLLNLYVRSALFGLAQFPVILSGHSEAVALMRLEHPDLLRWRDGLFDAVASQRGLDYDGIKAILEAERLTERQKEAVVVDLRFPHNRPGVDNKIAEANLARLVEFLAEEQGLKEKMDELEARMRADESLNDYYSIEDRRQKIREELMRLRERAYEMGQNQEEIV